jgi:hypothetical protein
MYLRSANIKNPQDKHKVLVFESCKIVERLIEDIEKVPVNGNNYTHTHGITTTKNKKSDRTNVDNEKNGNIYKSDKMLERRGFHDEQDKNNQKPRRRRRKKSKS